MPVPKEESLARLKSAIPHLLYAVKLAQETAKEKSGVVRLGVLAVNPDGTGKIEAQFDTPDFFADLAAVLDVPATLTAEQEAECAADRFLSQTGLR